MPDTQDLLGRYQIKLNEKRENGELIGWKQTMEPKNFWYFW